MAIIQGLIPPSQENWKLISTIWQLFPLFTGVQWLTTWYPMGKTSIESRFNIPGRIGWMTMEAPGFILLLYIMFTLPEQTGMDSVPISNWAMAGMFTIHYLYRAILYPLVQPSMSPIHIIVWLAAFVFQITNATVIGGWLAGYGPRTIYDWSGGLYRMEIGMVIWGWGLLANAFHDDDLREIRRATMRKQTKAAEEKAKAEGTTLEKVSVEKVYMIPKNGLFHYVLFAHYFCEWIEWGGWWMVGGWDCMPARAFFINEVCSMLPRALQGYDWYVDKFGKEKVGKRKAIVPFLL
ncbi:3-oxo-5-alpha-steroid 4-dehydrogenase-like protein [Venturia nashicola]|uniref:3-oxo-5-alpha-steroid 4-dehydrogenase-like protein n=1 Tax=Venturia nashicola TaxID=86259 RepID=A0A4Z1P5R8_9PEZI|nr:3-oxo-5-alpha-steroid 4-dehydrogenase-like protein [Venturia nashicola]TLD22619.1 3-oxo-5-alpha-steroid 4-dehydrogenase-like protein [Venturia nashicola]